MFRGSFACLGEGGGEISVRLLRCGEVPLECAQGCLRLCLLVVRSLRPSVRRLELEQETRPFLRRRCSGLGFGLPVGRDRLLHLFELTGESGVLVFDACVPGLQLCLLLEESLGLRMEIAALLGRSDEAIAQSTQGLQFGLHGLLLLGCVLRSVPGPGQLLRGLHELSLQLSQVCFRLVQTPSLLAEQELFVCDGPYQCLFLSLVLLPFQDCLLEPFGLATVGELDGSLLRFQSCLGRQG